jgi:hypothetical protein
MDVDAPRGLLRFFQDLPDPRAANARHPLTDIMAIALMAILSKAQDWVEVEAWGLANELWLATFLGLPHGIPSHDTFGRVFAALSPEAFEEVFLDWMNALQKATGGKLIAIDGKTLRRSFQVAGAHSAVHMCDGPRIADSGQTREDPGEQGVHDVIIGPSNVRRPGRGAGVPAPLRRVVQA